jgi:prophage regulatory protein
LKDLRTAPGITCDVSHVHLLRRPEVERLSGLSRSTLYALVAKGQFPAPVRIGIRAVAWRTSDLDAWLATRSYTLSGVTDDV